MLFTQAVNLPDESGQDKFVLFVLAAI